MGLFRRTIAAFLIAALSAPATALAQQPESTGKNGSVSPERKPATDLPVSLARIRRQLATTTSRPKTSRDGLRLEYYIDVYGHAPRIELFTPTENLTSAPVMYGGMTHQEFLQVVTPQEFKAPPADIGAVIAALIQMAAGKKKNSSAKR